MNTIKKIIQLIKQFLWDEYNLFFVGSSDKLPEPLPREKETEYVLKSMEGDEHARAKLIEHNLRLV
ncbi:MAG: RNA polymerase sporulation sigma factor SigE, partial [Firmicutes bacterium]|nr:RNA polymerase sporulation sigma factor SigE [Bacillota bacterium]